MILAEPVVRPEAIRQAALLWSDFYEEDATGTAAREAARSHHMLRA